MSEVREKGKLKEKARSLEIVGVFSKHNFYVSGFTPAEMRTTLEDLGPTYVKIGQIMSSRTDILPEAYCRELEKLRSDVKPLPASEARRVIEEETGRRIEEIYSEFRDEPLGSASIAQAHYAVLKDGTRVVTKVQRPGIADMMRRDFILLKKLASAVNIAGEADDTTQAIDLKTVLEELEKVTEEELDFRVEAENTKLFKEQCIEDETKIFCPAIIDELTTERILTMTYVDGYSIAKKDRLISDGCDCEAIAETIIENYLHQVLDVGIFHGDPHQGNIMISGGIPSMVFDVLKNLVKGRMKINLELTGYEELMQSLNETILHVVLAVFACVLFTGSCILCTTNITPRAGEMPMMSLIGFVVSIALGIYTVQSMSRRK